MGHKLVVLFKQPIVDDKLEYITDKKSNGYNIKNGRKKLKVGEIAVVNVVVKKISSVKTIGTTKTTPIQ